MERRDFDVIVAGGGPSGAIAALILVRAGVRVCLIEASMYERPRVGESLPPAARPLLCELSLWESFERLESVSSYGNESAWGSADAEFNSFVFNPHGYGWHLDRCQFDAQLASEAEAAGAVLMQGHKLISCTFHSEGSGQLVLRDKSGEITTLTTRAIIDATGRNGFLARQLGAVRKLYDRLIGIAVQYQCDRSDGGYTLIEATEHGWWYSALLPNQQMIAMFMTDTDICRKYQYAKFDDWKQNLAKTEHTQARLAGCTQLWGPVVFPAFSHRLQRLDWHNCWLACGDAAMGVDPLSSSGIMRALQGGEVAGYAMLRWLNGDSQLMQRYEHWIDAEFYDYMKSRQAYYKMEKRWLDSLFWLRRSSWNAIN
ncbi:MAG: NAD(P)/FAD-dependent oxidoreductase [Pseudomonadota bacterium]